MKDIETKRIQLELRRFLKKYRRARDLSAEQVADILEVKIATYRAMEGLKPINRVISSLIYLDKIAQLRSFSLSDFIYLLDNSGREESTKATDKRPLYQWEVNLLSHFNKIGIPLRNRFLRGLNDMDFADIKVSLQCFAKIALMPTKQRRSFINLVDEISTK